MALDPVPPDDGTPWKTWQASGNGPEPLALYALWLGPMNRGERFIQGIQVIETPTHKTAPSTGAEPERNWIRRANTALDLVLKFLDEHREITRPTSAKMQTFLRIPWSSTVRWNTREQTVFVASNLSSLWKESIYDLHFLRNCLMS